MAASARNTARLTGGIMGTHHTLINGTSYAIAGGTDLVNGTKYQIGGAER